MALISFSGLASGIDSQSIIQSILDSQRSARVKPLQNKISALEDTNSAFGEISGLLKKLKDAAYKFREIAGGAISKLGTSSDETVASVAVSNSAARTSSTLTVSQLARVGTQSFDDRFTSSSGALEPSLVGTGTVTVQIGTGSEQETVNLSVTNSTTLDELASTYNSQSTKGLASVVNTGTSTSPSYALVFTSLNEGTSKGTVSVAADATLTSQGVFNSATVSQAQDAQFSITGINGTITRSTNTVSDVITGLTFSLSKTGSTTINVGTDADATTATVQEFVDAYNELRSFIKDNDLIAQEQGEDGETKNVFGPLAGNSLDEQILTSLRSAMSGSTYSGGSEVKILADLGITTERDGSLSFNTDTFKSALAKESESAEQILMNFGETVASVNGTIDKYTQFNGLIDSVVNGNKTSITNANDSISKIEDSLAILEASLVAKFANLEKVIGGMQNQQQSLAASLGSLG